MKRWAPDSIHYERTESDYKHLIALRQKYRLKVPPIEELKAACLADGYPQWKVDSLKFPDTSKDDIEQIMGRKKVVVFPEEQVEQECSDSDNESESEIETDEEQDEDVFDEDFSSDED